MDEQIHLSYPQICARIQHFYQYLYEYKCQIAKENSIVPAEAAIDGVSDYYEDLFGEMLVIT